MSTTKTKPDIAYIALASRDVERTATFLGDHLELPAFTLTTPASDTVADLVDRVEEFSAGTTQLDDMCVLTWTRARNLD